MKRLVEEIREALPAMLARDAQGPGLADVAKALGASLPDVRAAAAEAKADPSIGIVVVRYSGNKRHLRLAGVGFAARERVCPVCDALFRLEGKSVRKWCTRACSMKARWADTAKRGQMLASCAVATERRRQSSREAALRRFADPEQRAEVGRKSKARWADPNKRQEMIAALTVAQRKPELSVARSERSRRRWQDPETKERMIQGNRRYHSAPEVRAEQSRRSKERWADEQYREEMRVKLSAAQVKNAAEQSDRLRARWADPDTRPRMLAGVAASAEARRGRRLSDEHKAKLVAAARSRNGPSQDTRERMAKAARKRWSDPEKRQRAMAGARVGGIKRRGKPQRRKRL